MFGLIDPPDESTLGKLFYRRGDFFEVAGRGDHPVLVHSCNVMSGWGCGIAAQFTTRYPHAKFVYDEYRQNERLDKLLGKCLWIPPPDDDPDDTSMPTHHIACLFVKEKGGAPIGDDEKLRLLHYFRLALEDFKRQLTLQDKLDNVHVGQLFCPKLNAGIFNISWRLSAEIIRQSGLDFIVVFRDNDREKTPDRLGPNELREEDTLLRSKMTGFNRLALRSAADDCLIPWLPGPYPPSRATISLLREANKVAKERQLVMRRPAKRRRYSPPDEEEEESRRFRKDPPCLQQERLPAPKLLSPLAAQELSPQRGRQTARTPQGLNEHWRNVWATKLKFIEEKEDVRAVGPIKEEEMFHQADLLREVHEGGGRLARSFEKTEEQLKLKLQRLPPAAGVQEVKRARMRNLLERREALFRLRLQQKRLSIMQLEQMARLEGERLHKSCGRTDMKGISNKPAGAPAIHITTPKGLSSHIFIPRADMPPPPRRTPSKQGPAETTPKKSSLKFKRSKSPLKVSFKLDKKGMPLMERFGYRKEKPIVDLTGSDADDDEEDDDQWDQVSEGDTTSSSSESEGDSLGEDDEDDSEVDAEGQIDAEGEVDSENESDKDGLLTAGKGKAAGRGRVEEAKAPTNQGHDYIAAAAAYAPSSIPSSTPVHDSSTNRPKKGMTLRPFLERKLPSQETETETETETEGEGKKSDIQVDVIEVGEADK